MKVRNRTFPMLDIEVECVLSGPLMLEPRLDQVFLLNTDPEHCVTHHEKLIVIPKWKGAPGQRPSGVGSLP